MKTRIINNDVFNLDNNEWVGYFGYINKQEYMCMNKIRYITYGEMMIDINRRYMVLPKL